MKQKNLPVKTIFTVPQYLKIIFTAVTCFSLYNIVDAQRRPTGAIINPVTVAQTPKKVQLSFRSFRGFPQSFSIEQYCPTPGDQGNHGTCVAFANGYGVATILYAKTHELTDKSLIDKYAFSATYLYEQIKNPGDTDCQNGSDPITALGTMADGGDAFLSAVPYSCGYTITDDVKQQASQYKIQDYSILFAKPGMLTTDIFVVSEEESISSTKKALLEGTPVSCAFFLPETFFHITSDVWNTNPAIDTPSDWKHSGHAMTIVGYDDNKYGGAFRVLNSWGTEWADKGFVWMRYKDYVQWCAYALQAFADPATPQPEEKNNDEPKPEPQDELFLSGSTEFKLNTGADMSVTKISTRNLIVDEDLPDEDRKEDLVAYRMNDTYTSGTKFRFYISTAEECYVYAFATDLTGKVNRILPFDDLMSTHIGANSIVAFPSDTKVVKMDEQKGTDYLLILYSKEKLDANEIANSMSSMRGSLSKKIKAALGSKLIAKEKIKYNSEFAGFSVANINDSNGTAVPLMIEMTHN